MPTGIWSSRWRSGCVHWDLDCEEEAAGEEAEAEEAEEEEENSSDRRKFRSGTSDNMDS